MLDVIWTVTRSHVLALFTDRNPHHTSCATRATPPSRCNCNGRGARMPSDDRLPILCRLRGHNWRRVSAGAPGAGGWTRDVCNRCRDLNFPRRR